MRGVCPDCVVRRCPCGCGAVNSFIHSSYTVGGHVGCGWPNRQPPARAVRHHARAKRPLCVVAGRANRRVITVLCQLAKHGRGRVGQSHPLQQRPASKQRPPPFGAHSVHRALPPRPAACRAATHEAARLGPGSPFFFPAAGVQRSHMPVTATKSLSCATRTKPSARSAAADGAAAKPSTRSLANAARRLRM